VETKQTVPNALGGLKGDGAVNWGDFAWNEGGRISEGIPGDTGARPLLVLVEGVGDLTGLEYVCAGDFDGLVRRPAAWEAKHTMVIRLQLFYGTISIIFSHRHSHVTALHRRNNREADDCSICTCTLES
jgi:hypothetical protein